MLSAIVDFVWGLPLVFLLIGGGFYLVIRMFHAGLIPLVGMAHAFKLVFGRFKHKGDELAPGQLSHFQALCNALAATVGLGNISGVAVAIIQGGPGAIFWMWVAALIGMNTKFFECSLAVMFRGEDYRGEVQGGPMYVIEKALGSWAKPLAIMFAVCGLLGTLALFQVNQLSAFASYQYSIEPWMVGFTICLLTGVILLGGVKRIAHVTTTLVPTMSLLYVMSALIIIILNFDKVPGIFAMIFKEAFTGEAAAGGAMGYAFLQVMKIGVKRAAFSNEAGVGTAPMAHGNAKTSKPISEGLVAMLGPFLDTIIICTMTSLVILIALPNGVPEDTSGIVITTKAFESALPGFGAHFLGVAVLLFGFTTIIGMANYNEKCWNFLFKGRWGLKENVFIIAYSLSLALGSLGTQDDVINLLDIGYGLMAVPNMIATLILAPKVTQALKQYLATYKIKS